MSSHRYPSYSLYDFENIGSIPSHWSASPVKRGFYVRLGKMLQPEQKSPDEILMPYLRAANIQKNGADLLDVKEMWFTPQEVKQLKLRPFDLLVSEGGDVGRSCIWKGELAECGFQNSINRVRPKLNNSNVFLFYWLSHLKSDGYIDVLCNKSTIAHFTAEKLANVPMPAPPLEEQLIIANFLERETAKIDALIEEQKRLIELLKEKRQAVISHAVTKGLDPSVPMKDSGVEWLGQVPAHWEINKLSRYFEATKGKRGQLLTKEYCGEHEGDYPVFSGQTENNGIMASIDDFEFDVGARGVLFSTTVGAKAMSLRHVKGRFSLSQNCMIIVPRTEVLNVRFYFYHLQPLFQRERDLIPDHMQPSFRMEDLYTYKFAIPPVREQIAIATMIDNVIEKFDELELATTNNILLLQERRAAIISAAVTGKIDVRDLVSDEAEVA
jgi:type I restriction enzyme S subunit